MSFTVTVQSTLALTLDAIATDNVVNIAEKAAGFAITGATGSEAGVSVTVTVGTTELTATSASADPATWSVSVPANAAYITGTGVSVSVTASKSGFTSPSAVTRTLAVDLAAPSVSYTAPSSLKVGVAITAVSPSTSDTDIDAYSATGLPSGLAIHASTGVISGTPDTADANTASVTVTVTDTAGNPAEVPLTFPKVDRGDQVVSVQTGHPSAVRNLRVHARNQEVHLFWDKPAIITAGQDDSFVLQYQYRQKAGAGLLARGRRPRKARRSAERRSKASTTAPSTASRSAPRTATSASARTGRR